MVNKVFIALMHEQGSSQRIKTKQFQQLEPKQRHRKDEFPSLFRARESDL